MANNKRPQPRTETGRQVERKIAAANKKARDVQKQIDSKKR